MGITVPDRAHIAVQALAFGPVQHDGGGNIPSRLDQNNFAILVGFHS